jgi:hypothetical protein
VRIPGIQLFVRDIRTGDPFEFKGKEDGDDKTAGV